MLMGIHLSYLLHRAINTCMIIMMYIEMLDHNCTARLNAVICLTNTRDLNLLDP